MLKKLFAACMCLALVLSGVSVDGAPSSGRSGGGFSSGSSSRSSGGFSSSRSGGGFSSSRPSTSSSRPSTSSSSRSGGGFSSSKPSTGNSSSSKSWFTPSKPTTKPTPTSSGSAGGAARAATASRDARARSVDNKVSKAVTTQGSKSSKQAAVDGFKTKYAESTKKGGQFTSHYDSEPTARPTHIPQTTNVGGSPVTVVYNSQYGGYGYMHPTLGTWMMYDMMSDAVMLNAMATRHTPVVASGPVIYSSGPPVWVVIVTIVMLVGGFILLAVVYNRNV